MKKMSHNKLVRILLNGKSGLSSSSTLKKNTETPSSGTGQPYDPPVIGKDEPGTDQPFTQEMNEQP
jgi:hypothetical protein